VGLYTELFYAIIPTLFPCLLLICYPYALCGFQTTKMTLERAASHIKVTCPPCLFWLLPWENVNRSTTLIYSMWVTSSH